REQGANELKARGDVTAQLRVMSHGDTSGRAMRISTPSWNLCSAARAPTVRSMLSRWRSRLHGREDPRTDQPLPENRLSTLQLTNLWGRSRIGHGGCASVRWGLWSSVTGRVEALRSTQTTRLANGDNRGCSPRG